MNRQNQLARNSQVQAARARLANRNVPGGAQQANMAGYPGGAQQANMAGCGDSLPGPYGGPGFPALPPGTIIQRSVVCNVIAQAAAGVSVTVQVTMRAGGLFFACGISSCNNCFEIIINQIRTGSLEVGRLPCGDVDAGMFNTDECWCPLDIGCFTSISPAEIEFSAFGSPSVLPFMNVGIWGDAARGVNDCGSPFGIPFGPNTFAAPGCFPGSTGQGGPGTGY